MKSTDEIAYPPRWEKAKKDLRIPTIVLAVTAPVCILFAVGSGGIEGWVFGVGALGGASLLFSFFSWHYLSVPWKVQAEIVQGGMTALVVRRLKITNWLWMSSAILGIPVFVIVSLRGDSVSGFSAPEGTFRYWVVQFVLLVSPVALVLLIILSVVFVFSSVATRRSPKGVGISADGVYHWWWGGSSFYLWDEMLNVQLTPPGTGPLVKFEMRRYDYPPHLAETALGRKPTVRRLIRKPHLGMLRTHPGLVYQALFFYLRNPDTREELRDDRAVERMKEGNYGEIPSEIEAHGRALTPEEAAASS